MGSDARQQPAIPEPQPIAAAQRTPSWPRVIATTAWLYTRRRLSAGTVLRVLPAVVVAVVAVAAAVVVIHHDLALRHASQSAVGQTASESAPGTSAADVAAAAKYRAAAASWVVTQVTPGTVVACDPLMCQALLHSSYPAGNIDQLGTGASDPLGAGVVISTAAVRSQLGARLTTVYAPAVLASFGTGPIQVAVLATAPDGAPAYQAAEVADLMARQQAGQQLVHNPNVRVDDAAAAQLSGGQVDARLLTTLATLAHQVPVDIISFSDSGPGASRDTPLRSMTISGSTALPGGGNYSQAVLAFLHAQQPPYPTTATATDNGGGMVLQISVTAPSPLGLLAGPAPG